MQDMRYLSRMDRKTNALLVWLAALVLWVSPAAAQLSEPPTITSEGFDTRVAGSTFYIPLMLDGVLGQDLSPEAAKAALKAAADDPHIKHAVFMIDSEEGLPLENEHIGVFSGDLEITAVIRVAIAPAIFPVFFADNIFMTETALVGGLPLHAFTMPGSKEVTAKQVGIFSSMLASAAQSRGHDPAIAYAMIDEKKDLYTWKEDGKTILANAKPDDPVAGKKARKIRNALPSSVLILDQKTAIDIGFAKPIDTFDDEIVGGYLGQKNWTRANHFARVAGEIGKVISELEPLREQISEMDKNLRDIKNNRDNRRLYNESELRGYNQFKKNLDKAVSDLDKINDALGNLYNVHPERHAYFAGPNGQTILADPDKWKEDLIACKKELAQSTNMLRNFTNSFRNLGGDEEYLYPINKTMEQINEHLRGIDKYGNAKYWDQYAKPDLPKDIYG